MAALTPSFAVATGGRLGRGLLLIRPSADIILVEVNIYAVTAALAFLISA
jgi:hypothetical protein